MKTWFMQLNQREQLSVTVMVVAVVLCLLYLFLWKPLATQRAALALQNTATAESLGRVDAMASEYKQLRKSGAKASSNRNLTTLINQSTAQSSLSVSRLQPNAKGEIQVRLENAAFDKLLSWLHRVEFREGLLVREVSVTQTGNAGRVNATVRIAQAG